MCVCVRACVRARARACVCGLYRFKPGSTCQMEIIETFQNMGLGSEKPSIFISDIFQNDSR